jgi:hypothetical protein
VELKTAKKTAMRELSLSLGLVAIDHKPAGRVAYAV